MENEAEKMPEIRQKNDKKSDKKAIKSGIVYDFNNRFYYRWNGKLWIEETSESIYHLPTIG